MGFSKSRTAVHKVQTALDAMLLNDGDFKIPSLYPTDLAYAIRNAYHVIKLYPKQYAEYTKVLDKFVIKTREDHILLVRKHDLISGSPVPVTPAGLAVSQCLTLPDVTSHLQVVGALIKHKAVEIVFPNFLDVTALDKIYKWTSNNGYYINSVDPLTISKHEGLDTWAPKST